MLKFISRLIALDAPTGQNAPQTKVGGRFADETIPTRRLDDKLNHPTRYL